ncbi:MAG: hypothetical protein ABI665_00160 [Vicinamibacterales bacterium]
MTDNRKNDLNLLLGSHTKDVATRLPKYADSFSKRVLEDVLRPSLAFFDKHESIRTSGRYTRDGEAKEIALAAHATREKFAPVRAGVAKLDEHINAKLAAKPAPVAKDPTTAIVNELRARELRERLQTLDPIDLQARFKSLRADAAGIAHLEAAENAPPGFPIAPAELVAAARERIAVESDPEIAELTELRASYAYALNVAEQALQDAGGNLAQVEPAPQDTRQPYLMSGAPLT